MSKAFKCDFCGSFHEANYDRRDISFAPTGTTRVDCKVGSVISLLRWGVNNPLEADVCEACARRIFAEAHKLSVVTAEEEGA